MPSEMEKLGGVPKTAAENKPRFDQDKFDKWMSESASLITAAGLELGTPQPAEDTETPTLAEEINSQINAAEGCRLRGHTALTRSLLPPAIPIKH